MVSDPGEFVSWAALVGAVGAIGAIVKFWYSRGEAEGRLMAEIENVGRAIEASQRSAQAAITRADIVNAQLHEHMLETAKHFGELSGMSSAMVNQTEAMKGLTERLDRFMNGRHSR